MSSAVGNFFGLVGFHRNNYRLEDKSTSMHIEGKYINISNAINMIPVIGNILSGAIDLHKDNPKIQRVIGAVKCTIVGGVLLAALGIIITLGRILIAAFKGLYHCCAKKSDGQEQQTLGQQMSIEHTSGQE
ncbi:MAG: hypothetical protein R3E91_05115 [Chlamydiales bacterium]